MHPRTRDLQPLGQRPAPSAGTQSTGSEGTHASLKRRRNGRSSQRVFGVSFCHSEIELEMGVSAQPTGALSLPAH